jgi:hypothetical protein
MKLPNPYKCACGNRMEEVRVSYVESEIRKLGNVHIHCTYSGQLDLLLAKILELGNDPKLYENIVEYFPPN